jgi:hypothetical protein
MFIYTYTYIFLVLGMSPSTLCMLSKCSVTNLNPNCVELLIIMVTSVPILL